MSLLKWAVLSTALSKIWLSVGPIFTVLPITPSFLVRFQPVKYRIEALDVLYPMVRGRSAKSSFWSSQRLGQTWSNFVNPGQTWSNLPKLQEMYSGPRLEGFRVQWTPVGSTWLGLGCLVLCADNRENPGG